MLGKDDRIKIIGAGIKSATKRLRNEPKFNEVKRTPRILHNYIVSESNKLAKQAFKTYHIDWEEMNETLGDLITWASMMALEAQAKIKEQKELDKWKVKK
jgi:NTP pyrophosphatase (non-canonical NTP hydrolase)